MYLHTRVLCVLPFFHTTREIRPPPMNNSSSDDVFFPIEEGFFSYKFWSINNLLSTLLSPLLSPLLRQAKYFLSLLLICSRPAVVIV